jgi:hypothetical protein
LLATACLTLAVFATAEARGGPVTPGGGPVRHAIDKETLDGAGIASMELPAYAPVTSDPFEPNNGPGQATYIGYNQWRGALIDPAGDRDFFSFYGSAGDHIVLDTDATEDYVGSPLDTYMILYDRDGLTVLAENDDGDPVLDSHIEYDLPASGEYFVEVRAYAHPNVGGPEYFYWLFLTVSDRNEPNDRITKATPIALGDVITGNISPEGDRDYFSFSGVAGQLITLDVDADVNGSYLDGVMELYAPDGLTVLAYSDDYLTLDPLINFTLPATGTYFVLLRDFGYPNGGAEYFYSLTFDQVVYMSASNGGRIGGVSFADGDILKHYVQANRWEMFFDASDVGVTRDVRAFEFDYSCLLMSFNGNQKLEYAGTALPQDIVTFCPWSLGEETGGYFYFVFDGSDVGLSTSSEAIDAMSWSASGDGLLVSTTGDFQVPGGSGKLTGADDDLLLFRPTSWGTDTDGTWEKSFDGRDVDGMRVEDVDAVAQPSSGTTYMSVMNGFKIGGAKGDGNDIFTVTPQGGGYSVAPFWDGSAAGFTFGLDAFGLMR